MGRGSASAAEGSAQRLDGSAFLQKLQAGQDHSVAGFETSKNGVGIADSVAQLYGDLVCEVAITPGRGNEDEGLAADAGDGENWHGGSGRGRPGDASFDELRVSEAFSGVGHLGFGEDALQTVIDLGRDEADGGACEDFAGGVENLDGQAGANVRGALRGDVDVGFEIPVLVDCGQEGGGRDVVAEVDGDVADDSGERCADLVVGELLLLRGGLSYAGVVSAFREPLYRYAF